MRFSLISIHIQAKQRVAFGSAASKCLHFQAEGSFNHLDKEALVLFLLVERVPFTSQVASWCGQISILKLILMNGALLHQGSSWAAVTWGCRGSW